MPKHLTNKERYKNGYNAFQACKSNGRELHNPLSTTEQTLTTTATATAIKTTAMTTLQKTIVGATLAVAVGTGIYEAHQTSTLPSHTNASPGAAQTLIDLSPGAAQSDVRKSITVTTNQAVLIQTRSGAMAVIQFLRFAESNAVYRWRYRAPEETRILTGADYVPKDPGRVRNTDANNRIIGYGTPGPIKLKAGDIFVEWSYGNIERGSLHYAPSLATITILPASEFDSRP